MKFSGKKKKKKSCLNNPFLGLTRCLGMQERVDFWFYLTSCVSDQSNKTYCCLYAYLFFFSLVSLTGQLITIFLCTAQKKKKSLGDFFSGVNPYLHYCKGRTSLLSLGLSSVFLPILPNAHPIYTHIPPH